MPATAENQVGAVLALWRYPVKSMLGEELDSAEVGTAGLLGDRAYALLDRADGKVATAKNPRKWPGLFGFRAHLAGTPRSGAPLPGVRVTLPDGRVLSTEDGDLGPALSEALGHEVTLTSTGSGRPDSWTARAEQYWPDDVEGLEFRDAVTEFGLPAGTFFDCATVHLLTTATLRHLQALHPEGRFEVSRFRPNLVVEPAGGESGFAEDAWIGRTIALGAEVRLAITGPCGRCVMTTLPQGGLPQDRDILRTAHRHHGGNVGVYATVIRGGTVRRGDPASVVEGATGDR